jgi:hypothetical protein
VIPLLTQKIEVIGQYLDLRRQYNADLPIPGSPVQELHLQNLSVAQAEVEILAQQARFHTTQQRSSNYPTEWVHVGLFQESLQKIIYYYQLRRIFDKKTPLAWANYPDEPPQWHD